MKIALVAQNIVRNDGQGRMNFELARHCLRSGVAVRLVADRIDPALEVLGAEWVRVRPRVARPVLVKLLEFVRAADRAVAELKGEVDVVVANGYSLRRRHDVNIANFVHDSYRRHGLPMETGRGAIRSVYQRTYTALNCRWERRAFAAAGTVVAISGRVRGELLEAGVPADKIATIPYGVDAEEFRPAADAAEADRSTFGLPSGVPLALFAGDIRTARKNLGAVLTAMRDVPALHLAVVGDAGGSPYPAAAQRLGVAGRVHFLGFRRDVAAVMRACDLFVFPTRYEPFGLVILEALASGLPVVTTAVAGAAELVTPACGAVLADPEDVGVLTETLREMTRSSAALARMSAVSRSVAVESSWGQMAGQYLELFGAVAARKVEPPGAAAAAPAMRQPVGATA